MRRRHLIVLGGGLFLIRLQSLRAQTTKLWRIGYLAPFSMNGALRAQLEFLSGMEKLGYIEGRDFVLERRSAEARYDRLDALAQELVSQNVDVIVAINTPAAVAAEQATTAIPIIFGQVGDPVAARLVANLARPGGNATGVTDLAADTAAKRLALLKEIIPAVSRGGGAVGPGQPDFSGLYGADPGRCENPGHRHRTGHVSSKKRGGCGIRCRYPMGADAIAVFPGTPNSEPRRIAEFALKARLPSLSIDDVGVREGLLLAYNANLGFVYSRMAAFVDKVLKGASPADIPTEQPTRLELVINLKTAREFGLAIPASTPAGPEELID